MYFFLFHITLNSLGSTNVLCGNYICNFRSHVFIRFVNFTSVLLWWAFSVLRSMMWYLNSLHFISFFSLEKYKKNVNFWKINFMIDNSTRKGLCSIDCLEMAFSEVLITMRIKKHFWWFEIKDLEMLEIDFFSKVVLNWILKYFLDKNCQNV